MITCSHLHQTTRVSCFIGASSFVLCSSPGWEVRLWPHGGRGEAQRGEALHPVVQLRSEAPGLEPTVLASESTIASPRLLFRGFLVAVDPHPCSHCQNCVCGCRGLNPLLILLMENTLLFPKESYQQNCFSPSCSQASESP